MFGIDINDLGAIFGKLPAPLQIAFAIGVACAGAWIVIRQLASKNTTQNVHPLAIELAKQAAELADAKVRQDLTQVVESTRVGIENRLERGLGEIRAMILTNEAQAKNDRHSIYSRMQELSQSFDRDLENVDARIRRLETRHD